VTLANTSAVVTLAALLAWPLAGASVGRPVRAASLRAAGIDTAGMDQSVRPGDDFFRFANGTWYKNTEIPPDRSAFGIWSVLIEQSEQRTRDILAGPPAGSPGSDARKAADYYAAYMDEAGIEAKGTTPIQDSLRAIAAIQDRNALTNWVCSSVRSDVDPLNNTNFYTDHLFGVWVAPALDDPARYAPYILQGGLGMPDRDYYIQASPEMDAVRSAYQHHIAATLVLAGIAGAEDKARGIFELERKIAAVHATRTESVEVTRANNPWPRDEFATRARGIDWNGCFSAAGLTTAPRIIVWHPTAITGIASLVGSEPLDVWRDYLTFHAVDHYADLLPKAFVEERFAFYDKVLSGTTELQPRWKRAIEATDGALGDAVGRLYVDRFFDPATRQQLDTMVKNLVSAFDRRIDTLGWMSPATKTSAKAKLQTLRVGVGYPDRWRSYSGLEVARGEAAENARRAELYDYRVNLAKIGQPVARDEWAMTPQTVNALNLPIQNALNFPAAILAPPFFDPAAPAAVNYGAIGSVIGHEISHSFDDQGSQFDSTGKLSNWWTPADFDHFKAASAKLVAQYNAYEPLPGLHVNGQLTLSENIADVAGLSAAYDAYVAGRKAAPDGADSFTDLQQFFIGFAQVSRTKLREPLLRQLILTDGHAPGEYRADTVRNLDPWYDAFGVKPGDRLYLAAENRVRVW
jgi:putative endopeptidase